MKKIFYTLIVLGLTSYNSFSQLLMQEEFNYGGSAGNITSVGTGWVGHSGVGSNSIQYATNSLTISGYGGNSAGGSINVTHASGTREDVNKSIGSKITSGTVYLSAIINVTNSGTTTGDYLMHFSDTFGAAAAFTAKSNNFKGRLFIRQGSGGATTFNIGLSKAATAAATVQWSSDLTVGSTYAIVMRYTIISGTANDSLALYLFNGSIPATEPLTPTLLCADNTGSDLTSVDAVCIRQGSSGTSTTNVDAIRVALDWANAPLPVTYKSFSVIQAPDANILKWATASESNNSHFDIQRSIDGKNFETIGKVKGRGNSSKVSAYQYSDNTFLSAKTIYYRLKQVDFDGKFEFSKTISISNNAAKAGISATLPNPFNDELSVTVSSATPTTATVQLMDMIGKLHHSATETLVAGSNIIHINTTDLPDGIYFVRLSYNGETFTQKVIKK